MHIHTADHVEAAVLKIQGMLQKIERLHLPATSRRDLESILVRQVGKELDRLLPWQAGHGQETAAVAIRIGLAANLDEELLHQLKLAALLHDIGLLMLPPYLQTGRAARDPESYVAIQNHPRFGANLLEPFSFLRDATIMIAHHHERWVRIRLSLWPQRSVHPAGRQNSCRRRRIRGYSGSPCPRPNFA